MIGETKLFGITSRHGPVHRDREPLQPAKHRPATHAQNELRVFVPRSRRKSPVGPTRAGVGCFSGRMEISVCAGLGWDEQRRAKATRRGKKEIRGSVRVGCAWWWLVRARKKIDEGACGGQQEGVACRARASDEWGPVWHGSGSLGQFWQELADENEMAEAALWTDTLGRDAGLIAAAGRLGIGEGPWQEVLSTLHVQ